MNSDPTSVDPGERGETRIGSGVVSKLAQQAAASVDGVVSVESQGLRRIFSAQNRDEATVDSVRQTTTINIEIGIEYPLPVRETAQRLREEITQRVEATTGLRVAEVNVIVSELRLGVE